MGGEVGDLLGADHRRHEVLHLHRRIGGQVVPVHVEHVDEPSEGEEAHVRGGHHQIHQRPHVADRRHPQGHDQQGAEGRRGHPGLTAPSLQRPAAAPRGGRGRADQLPGAFTSRQ